jgi:2-polyprenyl-3-methyl-5-hydroxy-6-metoxy-1,4-benzoquinol methylase
MKTSILKTLENLKLTSDETRKIFSNRTRDIDNLRVWRDEVSGVVFIDEYYTGDESYITGAYRDDKSISSQSGKENFEEENDAKRRFETNFKFFAGKKVADFGCGKGDFLRLIAPHCQSLIGIELQKNYLEKLNADKINCVSDIEILDNCSIDVCFSFHVLEHLPDPIKTLSILKNKIVKGGKIVIEVPHANDFLLNNVSNKDFKQFTLWSQHLVLHTRESLLRFLQSAGFVRINIIGVQRYPLSNHLYWLANGKPGGHKSSLSLIESKSLNNEYEKALAKIDATDTLIAVAKVP